MQENSSTPTPAEKETALPRLWRAASTIFRRVAQTSRAHPAAAICRTVTAAAFVATALYLTPYAAIVTLCTGAATSARLARRLKNDSLFEVAQFGFAGFVLSALPLSLIDGYFDSKSPPTADITHLVQQSCASEVSEGTIFRILKQGKLYNVRIVDITPTQTQTLYNEVLVLKVLVQKFCKSQFPSEARLHVGENKFSHVHKQTMLDCSSGFSVLSF